MRELAAKHLGGRSRSLPALRAVVATLILSVVLLLLLLLLLLTVLLLLRFCLCLARALLAHTRRGLLAARTPRLVLHVCVCLRLGGRLAAVRARASFRLRLGLGGGQGTHAARPLQVVLGGHEVLC